MCALWFMDHELRFQLNTGNSSIDTASIEAEIFKEIQCVFQSVDERILKDVSATVPTTSVRSSEVSKLCSEYRSLLCL